MPLTPNVASRKNTCRLKRQVHPLSRCERRASGQCSEFKLEDFSQSLFGSAFFDCRLGIGQ